VRRHHLRRGIATRSPPNCTALFAIILQRSITASLAHHRGGAQAITALSQQARAHAAPALAAAFGTTSWIAAAMIAALLLPRPPAQRSA
jgi:hypothetical protein